MGLGEWIKRLTGHSQAQATAPSQGEAQTAAATLLVQLALADDHYDDGERDVIVNALRTVFGMDGVALNTMMNDAETAARGAVDHYQFTRTAKTLPPETREALVEAMWDVTFADGKECRFEQAMVRKLADLLYVEQRLSRLARKRATSAGDPPNAD